MNQDGSQEKIIRIDEVQVKRELNDIVRSTVEEPVNKLLDAEADELCGVGRYEQNPGRIDTRAGHLFECNNSIHTIGGRKGK
ncbi:MAG: hypothetical protein SAMD01599839_01080 [Rectinema sp.]